jgi:hypothetical protein
VIFLGKIDDSFQIHNCCVVVFKLLTGRIRAKDPIQLRLPDGQIRDTYIAGFEHMKYSLLASPDRDRIGISPPRELRKQDVPPGTEIWKHAE